MDEQEDSAVLEAACLYVWLSPNETGAEGILVAPLSNGVMYTLVFDDETRACKLMPFVREQVDERGLPARLVRFERGGVVAEIQPGMGE
jgi:hypothetical protein